MIKQTNRSLLYLIGAIVISSSLYSAYRFFTPKPVDINAVYTNTAVPAVIIQGNDVYVKDGQLVPQGTAGAKWVPPGTYAGMPSEKGRTINGHFFAWGTYGTKPTPEERQKASQDAAAFTQAVRQAAGLPATTNQTNGKGNLNLNPSLTTPSAVPAVAPAATPSTPVTPSTQTYNVSDLNQDGKVNVLDYNIFVANYNKRAAKE